ncbi:C-5 sterol desaturase desaturase [Coccidioides immitis RMSCC 3703]|uniref:C-5 sterol desaturase desaturase n=1 Tax=Coccidioides immitis RMSCC 3703 TaxID=454286 RepID=A0A0J8R072_COCIT|nr:C-5 sterol desaturase desaturase [Coccidioides immitis RMSCC 3703]
MAILTVPFFLAEVRGYGKIYDTFAEAPFQLYNILQFPLFFMFTDGLIYWIHRGLHHPLVYKAPAQSPHHKWIMPTPVASHAFHPVDGWGAKLAVSYLPIHLPAAEIRTNNYDQFTTLWDRLGSSYRKPNDELFRRETKMGEEEWKRQVQEMETLVKEVEGDDDRQYLHEEEDKKNL